jgi:hypothetical protein
LNIDLRILFLFLLAVTAFLFILRRGTVLKLSDIIQIVLDFFLVLAMGGTAGSFFFLLTRQDPMPLLRNMSYQQSLEQLVSFEHAIPPNLANKLAVSDINRTDTDGDGFKEWVVFYQFDLQNPASPVLGTIYDNDRGNPPVIFPYTLRPPNRDYLSEGRVSFSLQNVTKDKNGPNGEDINEILVNGNNELAIFRFLQNSAEWDFPRDAPLRYQPIGFFRGSGGVWIDKNNKQVTVLDRAGYERSQLVNRKVYGLNSATNTYWDQFYQPEELNRKLAAPLISTIDFIGDSPDNILGVTFPEKIVMAFYAATCSTQGEALCRHAKAGWDPKSFLDPNGEAFTEFQNKNVKAYFGIPSASHSEDIAVSYLRYYPQLETDSDLLPTGGGRDVVTGEEAQTNVVDITFVVGKDKEQTARYVMTLVNGQWKMARRVLVDLPALGAPTQLPATPQ